jgi:hypothetical protein
MHEYADPPGWTTFLRGQVLPLSSERRIVISVLDFAPGFEKKRYCGSATGRPITLP